MLELDHIAVLGETLDAAQAYVARTLGQDMGPGGPHPRFGTHNRLMGLEPELYLEAIAIDPDADPICDARWFGLDTFAGPPRLDKWICRVQDMDATLQALPMAGRKVSLSRGDLRWTMAVPEDGMLPFAGMFPALIEWHTEDFPGKHLAANGVRFESLTVSHPQAGTLSALLSPYLQAENVRFETAAEAGLRADLTLPEGGSIIL